MAHYSEIELIERASRKKVLFLGEKIIDVYHYVRPLGRPTKDAIVSVELVTSETFNGGVQAAAAHAGPFCNGVDVDIRGDVYRKERWIEASHLRKLFECYVLQQDHREGAALSLEDYDCVIVTDYGHGMADKEFIASLDTARYLAVNVQTNSGNYGFNLATKYSHCDYLCVDEPEARLATQNRSGPIEDSLRALAAIADKVVITQGREGAIGEDAQGIVECHAFTNYVVDTIGAGDAFFAVTALIAEDADMRSLLRIGNAAGAIKAGIVGHQRSITKHELIDYLARVPA
jgi:hypothetical protein